MTGSKVQFKIQEIETDGGCNVFRVMILGFFFYNSPRNERKTHTKGSYKVYKCWKILNFNCQVFKVRNMLIIIILQYYPYSSVVFWHQD